MIKRIIAKELPGGFYLNVHARTHFYFHVGAKIAFERIPCWIVGDCEIYSLDVHVFLFFVDVMVNLNKALGGKK